MLDGHLGLVRATNDGKPWATILGRDETVAVRLTAQLAEYGFAGITSRVEVWQELWSTWPGQVATTGQPDCGFWSLWVNAGLAPDNPRSWRPFATEPHARELALDDPRIRGLLAFSSSAHVFPGDHRIVRWIGIDINGDLVAVAGQITAQGGACEVVSVCTHPDFRGLGLAGECVATLMNSARQDGITTVILEAYTQNSAAAAVYRRVGFSEVARYCSWELADTSLVAADLS